MTTLSSAFTFLFSYLLDLRLTHTSISPPLHHPPGNPSLPPAYGSSESALPPSAGASYSFPFLF